MYPGAHAATRPDHPAVIMGRSGEVVTYRQLDERSNQLARLWRERGLVTGDHVAIFSENQPRFFEVMWAALRSGLYVTTINSCLSAEEVGYILRTLGLDRSSPRPRRPRLRALRCSMRRDASSRC